MKLSRYAVKKVLRDERHRVASRHGISFHKLSLEFRAWYRNELMGCSAPPSKDEEIRAELEWLRNLDKKLAPNETPPAQFCRWFNPGAPVDACQPYDFPQVYIWEVGGGAPRKVDPHQLPKSVDGSRLYWRPVFADEADLSLLN